MDTDSKDITAAPLQLVAGDNGKPVVPAVIAKTAAIMPDGRECWIYPDGAVRAADGRLMIAHPKIVPYTITADNSRELTKRRDQLGVERALIGMQMAADDLGITVDQPADLWSHIIRSQAVHAVRKRATDAARLVGQASRQLPDRSDAEPERPATGPSVDVEALIRLARAMDREVERRVAEATAVDGVVMGD